MELFIRLIITLHNKVASSMTTHLKMRLMNVSIAVLNVTTYMYLKKLADTLYPSYSSVI